MTGPNPTRGEKLDEKAAAERWLNEQGYRLEHRTALALENAGFATLHGAQYTDLAGKEREVDVLGKFQECKIDKESSVAGCVGVEVSVLCECKYTKKHPWILRLPAPRPSSGSVLRHIPQSPSLQVGTASKRRLTSQTPLTTISQGRDSFWRSVEVAHSPRHTGAYNAILKVTEIAWKAARSVVHDGVVRRGCFVQPVIVIDGSLYASEYCEADDSFSLERRKIGHLLWSGQGGLPTTLIDVVEESSLPEYLILLKQSRDELAAFAINRLQTAPSRWVPTTSRIPRLPATVSAAAQKGEPVTRNRSRLR